MSKPLTRRDLNPVVFLVLFKQKQNDYVKYKSSQNFRIFLEMYGFLAFRDSNFINAKINSHPIIFS